MKFQEQTALLWGQRLFLLLCGIFCIAYPIAVTGVAFDVRPPFSLAWAASALLFLEGLLLIVAASLRYGFLRGVCAGLIVIVLSYLIEAVGVGTGFPFGVYRYTGVLLPHLPGGVPLPVMFAWVLIVFGAYGWVHVEKRPIGIIGALVGAALATLLDLEIEPVAAHLEHYWEWLVPGAINYYGVPLANFVAWFVVAFVLLLLVDRVLLGKGLRQERNGQLIKTQTDAHKGTTLLYTSVRFPNTFQGEGVVGEAGQQQGEGVVGGPGREQGEGAVRVPGREQGKGAVGGPGHPQGDAPPIYDDVFYGKAYKKGVLLRVPLVVVVLAPRILFGASLFMFGLVDVTHGYYVAALLGIIAGLVLWGLFLFGGRRRYA